jgi:uncharacterized protein
MSDDNHIEISFLGKGWSFPPEFIKSTKTTMMSSDANDIKESLEILLSTKIGERMMNPKYGCDLGVFVFDTFNVGTETYMKDIIKTAILNHETRIKLDDVGFSYNKGKNVVFIDLQFTIRNTNSRSNMVYPFYLTEGTNIK